MKLNKNDRDQLNIAIGKCFAKSPLDMYDKEILLKEGTLMNLINEYGLNENQAREVILWCQLQCQKEWGQNSFYVNKYCDNDNKFKYKSPYSDQKRFRT